MVPANNHVTKLLIISEHINLLHAGPTLTLASLRTKYWPMKGRNQVRKIIHSCITCFRASPKLIVQKMGNLPTDRVESCRPFFKIGIDYFGHIYLKEGSKRSKRKVKVWVALFVCLVTRAIHLEIVGDLTTQCFLNALKRLISRRGHILHIYCDNAKTFVGAKAELKEFRKFLHNIDSQSDINSFLLHHNISWHFIPPKAPNFGGLWERMVRSVKSHFKKVVMNALLTYEEAANRSSNKFTATNTYDQ